MRHHGRIVGLTRVALALAVGGLAAGSWAAVAAPAQRHPARASVAGNVPRLSPAQIRAARSILRRDRSVARLFHAVRFRVAHVGPWSTGGDQNRLIGVVFFVDLAAPTNVAGIWPTAIYEPKLPFPSYREEYEYFRTVALRAVTIAIDLARRRVAEVRPS
jgi:hypothetical protein